MKIIHCADLHLDSKMNANLDKDKAKKRRAEILDTYTRMVTYARNNGVDAILICGDLFDTSSIQAVTKNVVLDSIIKNPGISFYYLRGNHDTDNFLIGLDELPKNLYMFDSCWKTYHEADGQIAITGIELDSKNQSTAYVSLVLDNHKINIVMLHGQEAESSSKDKAEIINLRELKNKGIDYLALGHIHGYKMAKLDAGTMYCYPGCLEGRGFDECGEHGFVLLDVNELTGIVESEFVPFASRNLYEVIIDVTGCVSSTQIIGRIDDELNTWNYPTSSLIKITLTGMLDVECEKDVNYIETRYSDRFFFCKINDETKLKVDEADYRYDESLKGEFVRMVLQDTSIADEDKATVIRYGIQAIKGEEVQ